MAEVKPASDALLNKQEQLANSNIHYCHSTDMRRILARLRKAEKERDALNDSMAIYVDAEIVELIRARARGIARAKGGGDG